MPKNSLIYLILVFWFALVMIIFYRDFQKGTYFNDEGLQVSSGSQIAEVVHVSCTTESSPRLLLFTFQSDHISEFAEKIKASILFSGTVSQNHGYAKDQVGIEYTFDTDAPRSFQLKIVSNINKTLGTSCILDE